MSGQQLISSGGTGFPGIHRQKRMLLLCRVLFFYCKESKMEKYYFTTYYDWNKAGQELSAILSEMLGRPIIAKAHMNDADYWGLVFSETPITQDELGIIFDNVEASQEDHADNTLTHPDRPPYKSISMGVAEKLFDKDKILFDNNGVYLMEED